MKNAGNSMLNQISTVPYCIGIPAPNVSSSKNQGEKRGNKEGKMTEKYYRVHASYKPYTHSFLAKN
jgi:hypothetical protein